MSLSCTASGIKKLLPNSPVACEEAHLALFIRGRKAFFAKVVYRVPFPLSLKYLNGLQKEILTAGLELVDGVERWTLEGCIPLFIGAVSLENAIKEKNFFFRLDRSIGDFAVLLCAALSQVSHQVAFLLRRASHLFRKLGSALHLLQG